MREPHSSEIAGRLTQSDSAIGSNEKRTSSIRKYNLYWRYLITAAVLYALGVTLIAQGFLYPALVVMACGGACCLTGLRQAGIRHIKLNKNAQQKLIASKSLYDEPSYRDEPGRVVERDDTYSDLSNFKEHAEPILVFQINEKITRNDLQSYITTWEHWLARKEPFGVLIVRYDDASQADLEIIKMGHQWHRSHKSHISQYCAGIAVVTIATRQLEPGASTTRAMRIWLGCPGQICATETEARAWLASRLQHDQKKS